MAPRPSTKLSIAVLAGALIAAGIAAPSVAAPPGPAPGRFAFVQLSGSGSTVRTMRSDGKQRKTVKETADAFPAGFFSARLSPDGKRLVYVHGDLQTTELDVWVSKANGKGAKRIVESTGKRIPISPNWSPDGKRIVYSEIKVTNGKATVFTIGADGKGKHKVRKFDKSVLQPTFSPDGKLIAFTRLQGGALRISIMQKDGKVLRTIGKKKGASLFGSFSPDGKRVAFVRYGPGAVERLLRGGSGGVRAALRVTRGAPAYGDAFTMDLQGKAMKRVSKDRTSAAGAAYTPDGKRLLMTRFVNETADLYSIPVKGGKWKRLTKTIETYNIIDFFGFST